MLLEKNRHAGTRLLRLRLALAVAIVLLLGVLAAISPAFFVSAQSPDTSADWEKAAGGKMAFDVASVKANRIVVPWRSSTPFSVDDEFPSHGGLLSITDTLPHLISFAYRLDGTDSHDILHQMALGMTQERFDIQARSPEATTRDQLRLMMQSLLEDRFGLKEHFETKEQPVFKLVLIKPGKTGPQLRPHADDPPCSPSALQGPALSQPIVGEFPAVCHNLSPLTPDATGARGFAARDVSMQDVAYVVYLSSNLGRRVVDQTGLTGNFDFVFTFSAGLPAATSDAASSASPADSGPIFSEALKNQLGLKLEPATGRVETFVLDHIEEPTPN